MTKLEPPRAGREPFEFHHSQLSPATCRECRREVWAVHSLVDGPVILDREWYRGIDLLSLHPCCYELTEADVIDPDWGYVGH